MLVRSVTRSAEFRLTSVIQAMGSVPRQDRSGQRRGETLGGSVDHQLNHCCPMFLTLCFNTLFRLAFWRY
jgi:hypothetical protein